MTMKPLDWGPAKPEPSMEDDERWVKRPMRLALSWSSPLLLLLVMELACESACSSLADHYLQILSYAIGSLGVILFAYLVYYWFRLYKKAVESSVKVISKKMFAADLLFIFIMHPGIGEGAAIDFMHHSNFVFWLCFFTFCIFSPVASSKKYAFGLFSLVASSTMKKYSFVAIATLVVMVPATFFLDNDGFSIIIITMITLFSNVYSFYIVRELVKTMQATVDQLQSNDGSTVSRQT